MHVAEKGAVAEMVDFFKWGSPQALGYLWLVPALLLLHLWAMRRRREALEKFCPDHTAARTGLVSMLRRRDLKSLLFIGAAALLVVVLADPMVGVKKEKARRRGAEVVIAIDTSRSMGVNDVQPYRLEAAKQAATSIISRLTNERIALVVFAGNTYKYCPLTIDHDAALMFLDSIGLDSSPQPGTAVAEAIRIAGEVLGEAEGKHRALLLISDGEDHGSGVLEAANTVNRETGAVIVALGVGTPEGAPIPQMDQSGNVVDFKRDETGEVIVSKLHEGELQQLAKAGNGLYKRLSDPGATAQISARLESLEGIQVGTYVYTDYGHRFQWPLVLAILLLAIEALVAEQRLAAGRRGKIA